MTLKQLCVNIANGFTRYSLWKGGGGGSSSYNKVLLYKNNGVSRENITLSDSYKNYDYLDITFIKYDDRNYYDFMHTFIDCNQQEEITSNNFYTGRTNTNILDLWATGNNYARYKFNSDTSITYPNASGNNAIYSIYGIKF